MIAQHFRQLNVYCFHLYLMKNGNELNCCVFILREYTIILCENAETFQVVQCFIIIISILEPVFLYRGLDFLYEKRG